MKTTKLVWIAAALSAVAVSAAGEARAQVCSSPAVGEVEIDTAGVPVTIKVAANGILKVNGVSCGFVDTSIAVFGTAANDNVSFRQVPTSIALSVELGAGIDTVAVFGSAALADAISCTATAIDRDDDGTPDVGFGESFVELVYIHGGSGDDVIDCAPFTATLVLSGDLGDDTLIGGIAADTLKGDAGSDILQGGPGNDTLDGGLGDDQELGGDGNDRLMQRQAGNGSDQLHGGDGLDTVTYASRIAGVTLVAGGGGGSEDLVDDAIEFVIGGKGDDSFQFAAAAVGRTYSGGPGNDTLIGSALADFMSGQAGDDTLTGNGGADRLDGGLGGDHLDGGAGKDTIYGGANNDTVADTADGIAERIDCGADADVFVTNLEDTFIGCELAPPPSSTLLANGSFETGDYTSWTVFQDAQQPDWNIWGIGDDGVTLHLGDTVFDFFDGEGHVWGGCDEESITPSATDGTKAAVELCTGPGVNRMYQDVRVPDEATELTWDMAYLNMAGFFSTEDQSITVQLRDPLTDVVRAVLYQSTEGRDLLQIPMKAFSADVSEFAGQIVRVDVEIRIFQFCFHSVYDNFAFQSGDSLGARAVEGRPAALSFAMASPDHQADGDQRSWNQPDAADGSEGGCAAGGRSPLGAAWLLLALVLAFRRRR